MLACAIGGWNGWAGLAVSGATPASFVCVVTVAWAIGWGGYLAVRLRALGGEGTAQGVLAIAVTYAAALAGGRAGPLSAGVEGLALLGLAMAVQHDLRVHRHLPTQTLRWSRRTTYAVVAVSAVLDTVVELVAGGGKPDPASVSSVAVLACCLGVTGFVVVVVALAERVQLTSGRAPEPAAAAADTRPL